MTLDITRREVIAAGAAGGAAVWLASTPAPALGQPGDDAPAHLERTSYRAGDALTVAGVALRVEAVVDIDHARERGLEGSDLAFALLLSGAAAAPLAQGSYRVDSPSGWSGDLFVVPVGRPAERRSYEVVVDRSVRIARADAPSPAPAGVAGTSPAAAMVPAAAGKREDGAAKPDRRYAFLRSVTIRRGRPGARARVRVAKGSRLERVSVKVVRDGVVLARGSAEVQRSRALVGLRLLRPVRRGSRYEVVVTATDRDGVKTTVRRGAVLR